MSADPSTRSQPPDVTARLVSDDALGPTGRPELVLRCHARAFEVWVDTKVAASLAGPRVRWDDAPAESYAVWVDGQSRAERLVTPDPEAFLRKAMKARRLRFEFTPQGGPPEAATFQLAGISSVVIRLQEACPALRTGR